MSNGMRAQRANISPGGPTTISTKTEQTQPDTEDPTKGEAKRAHDRSEKRRNEPRRACKDQPRTGDAGCIQRPVDPEASTTKSDVALGSSTA